MPATPTGRGAQVVLDPISSIARAARGAYASTLEANLQKRRDDVAAGLIADGYAPDGRPNSGTVAVDLTAAPSFSLIGPPYVMHALTVGETYQVPDNTPFIFFNNPLVANATIIMPPNPLQNQRQTFTWFSGVTTLVVQGSPGQTLSGPLTTANQFTPATWQIMGIRWQRV